MMSLPGVSEDGEEYEDDVFYFSIKHALPPLDLSFKSLLTADDIKEEIETHYQKNLSRCNTTNKYTCNAIRINNNSLNELGNFTEVISGIVTDIKDIAWLDFAFNDLTGIDDEILNFVNLKVLYLHGNAIEKIQDVKKLVGLTQLHTLTIHGNPIESEVGYRHYILSILPRLKTFDFSAVTKQDRSTASVWMQLNPRFLKRKRKKHLDE